MMCRYRVQRTCIEIANLNSAKVYLIPAPDPLKLHVQVPPHSPVILT